MKIEWNPKARSYATRKAAEQKAAAFLANVPTTAFHWIVIDDGAGRFAPVFICRGEEAFAYARGIAENGWSVYN